MTEPDDTFLFTPYIPARLYSNGWTADAQVAFIAALARTGVVAVAARGVGKSPRSAYQLRARAGAESFADAWDRAISEGQARAIEAALSRTLEPVLIPIMYRGRQVGQREKFDAGLAIAAMRALDRRDDRCLRTPVADDGASREPTVDRLQRYIADIAATR